MSALPLLSVVVPAYNAETVLPVVLDALTRSHLDRRSWELIVVDDGSTDDTAGVAASFADRVVRLPAPPQGPGRARNRGAAEARGQWLVFIDADVRVHPDTLGRFAEHAGVVDGPEAVFGAYDAHPVATGLVSSYRNLLHRHTHLLGAGPAETFWAGCGGVHRDTFLRLGGFDTTRYPRPQIEDIELGYRLRDSGSRIVLDPALTGAHLKEWTLFGMLRTDVRDRGVPWMRLLLERHTQSSAVLNARPVEQLKVALAGVAGVALLGAPVRPEWFLPAAAVALAGVTALSLPFLRWLAQQRGASVALQATPLHLLHYGSAAIAAGVGVLAYLAGSLAARRMPSGKRGAQ